MKIFNKTHLSTSNNYTTYKSALQRLNIEDPTYGFLWFFCSTLFRVYLLVAELVEFILTMLSVDYYRTMRVMRRAALPSHVVCPSVRL